MTDTESPYYSMHDNLPKLRGMNPKEAEEFVKPFGYTIAVINENDPMVKEEGFTVSVKLNENGVIKDIYAFARPITKPADGMHQDAWDDSWLDKEQQEILLNILKKGNIL
jgi:hypothetical protein